MPEGYDFDSEADLHEFLDLRFVATEMLVRYFFLHPRTGVFSDAID